MRDKFPHLAEESEQVDLKKLLTGAWHYWYLFVLGLALCVGAALLYLRYTTPQYEVSSKLLIKDDKKGPELRGDAVFSELDIFKSSNNIDNEIEVLKSISLMERVLTELSLQTSYYEDGKIVDRELYGRALPVKVKLHTLDSTALAPVMVLHLKNADTFRLEERGENDARITDYRYGQKIQRPYASFTVSKNNPLLLAASAEAQQRIIVEFHHLRALADYYHEKLVVEPVSKTASALTISLRTPVPEKGTDIINKLIDVYTREGVEDKNFMATSTIHFLDERLEYLINELTVVEKSIEDYKRRMEIADVSSQARQYVDHASENSKQLADWSIQIEVLESIESYLQKQGNEGEVVPSTLGIKDPTLLSLIARFNELQLERERMLRTTQPNNPIVQNMVTELANLRTSIL
ncbi:MAG: capsular biosynthesis protein, partial [Bacteroidetes bacterium]|nr:capsular biosynthesis protein [Bacteroidota bacterium]